MITSPGVFSLDVDEEYNRIAIGVTDQSAVAALQKVISNLGIPDGAVSFKRSKPVQSAATLQDYVRPLRGGLQIAYQVSPSLVSACTLGVNFEAGGVHGFITNSHCTPIRGGTSGTAYYQPVPGSANFIGTEYADPGYHQIESYSPYACPEGERCRLSDAALVQYAGGIDYTLGYIARPWGTTWDIGSIEINPTVSYLRIRAENVHDPMTGELLNKIGAVSGWTYGSVEETCELKIDEDGNIFFCQYTVSAGVRLGDSGAPVFAHEYLGNYGGLDVTLYGILWGKSGDTLFVYSPMDNIEAELGVLTTRYPMPPAPLDVEIQGDQAIPPDQLCGWMANATGGDEPYTFSWERNSIPVPGATEISYTDMAAPGELFGLEVHVWDSADEHEKDHLWVYADSTVISCAQVPMVGPPIDP